MKALSEFVENRTRRFAELWNARPEPTYDPSVRAPRERFLPLFVPLLGIIMIAVIVGQALQRSGWPA